MQLSLWRSICRFLLLQALVLLLIAPLPGLAEERVSVLYPDVSPPYSLVFEKIIDGIRSERAFSLNLIPLGAEFSKEELQQQVTVNGTQAIIALGRRGRQAATELQNNLPTVLGAVPLVPQNATGISLSANPEQLFATLKAIAPETRTVSVVYSPTANAWLLPFAEQAAERQQLQLKSFPVKDLREAMLRYREILNGVDSRTEALWLPLDHISSDDDVVLPLLLREAWKKDLIIFSSKPTDAQRGALFSMYPDNFGHGRELAALLTRRLATPLVPTALPAEDLLLAVNLRTAAHLGINFTTQQQQHFDLTFPSR